MDIFGLFIETPRIGTFFGKKKIYIYEFEYVEFYLKL